MHRRYMLAALEEAKAAYEEGEVPVGAVLVADNSIVAVGHNRTGAERDPREHAEMIVLREGHSLLGPRLTEASLYVTLEPCPMCAGAIVLSRVGELFFGAFDSKAGATGTLYDITGDSRLNHQVKTLGGILDAESRELLQMYFRVKRTKGVQ